jgi:CRP-like cAMP-binding protein
MEAPDALRIKFLQTGLFTEEQADEACRHFSLETPGKNQYFLEAGRRCSRIGFLEEGILCTFVMDSEGHEVVKYFVEAGQFFTDMESYTEDRPARLNILALTEARIFYITRSQKQELQHKVPQSDYVFQSFAAQAMNRMIRSQHFLHMGTAVDQYKHFIEHYPELAQNVPLKYIASYLGITQSSLSRIRNQWM